ncbi:MAG: hypothetical protein ACOC3Z_00615 [Nanoarchaeota archaeon]
MAIKNTNLGGTDWTNEEQLKSLDLNDTFDAAFNKIQTLSTFWLNDELYEVYDDFDSYSTGTFATEDTTKWTITTTTNATATISNTQNAGGTTNELKISVTSPDTSSPDGYYGTTAVTTNLVANRHTYARLYWTGKNAGSLSDFATIWVGFNNSFSVLYNFPDDMAQNVGNYIDVIIINTGDGDYDLYLSGKKIASYSGVSAINAQLSFRVRAFGEENQNAELYIDDVRQSGFDVN